MPDSPTHPTVPPPAPRTRTCVLAAIVFGVSVLLTGLASPDEELLTAELAAPTVLLHAESDGQVVAWLVKPGSEARPGAKLLQLRDDARGRAMAAASADIARLESELQRRQAKAAVDLSWRVRSLDGEIMTTQLKTAELLQREYDRKVEYQVWRETLRSTPSGTKTVAPDDVFHPVSHTVEPAQDRRLTAMRNHETARNAMEVAHVQLLLCEERLRSLRQLRDELPERIRRAAGVAVTERELSAARERLRQLEQAPAQRELAANAYGRIVTEFSQPGSRVKAGDVLARIVDDERRYLSVPVPADKLPRFEPGMTVRIRFPGDQVRQGTVAAIGSGAQPGTIRVKPAGKLWPKLPLGSAVQIIVPRD